MRSIASLLILFCCIVPHYLKSDDSGGDGIITNVVVDEFTPPGSPPKINIMCFVLGDYTNYSVIYRIWCWEYNTWIFKHYQQAHSQYPQHTGIAWPDQCNSYKIEIQLLDGNGQIDDYETVYYN